MKGLNHYQYFLALQTCVRAEIEVPHQIVSVPIYVSYLMRIGAKLKK